MNKYNNPLFVTNHFLRTEQSYDSVTDSAVPCIVTGIMGFSSSLRNTFGEAVALCDFIINNVTMTFFSTKLVQHIAFRHATCVYRFNN
jgi:hypothetical protein